MKMAPYLELHLGSGPFSEHFLADQARGLVSAAPLPGLYMVPLLASTCYRQEAGLGRRVACSRGGQSHVSQEA